MTSLHNVDPRVSTSTRSIAMLSNMDLAWKSAAAGGLLAAILVAPACTDGGEEPLADGAGTGSNADDDGPGPLDSAPGTTTTTTGGNGGGEPEGDGTIDDGGSGGAEESGTGFGMDDDMPLVADIPSIKMGEVAIGEWVHIPDAIATTRDVGYEEGWRELCVQDPIGGQYSGVVVQVPDNNEFFVPGDPVEVVGVVRQGLGYVYIDATGRNDEIDVTGDDWPELTPVDLDVNTIFPFSPTLPAHQAVVVRLQNLKVTSVQPSGSAVLDGRVVVDERYSGELPPLEVGDTLSEALGPLLLTPDGIAIAPRSADDLVP